MRLIGIIIAILTGGLLILTSCSLAKSVEPTPASFTNSDKLDVKGISYPLNTPVFTATNPKLTPQAAAIVAPQADNVYITEKSTTFHRSGCRYLWNSRTPIDRSRASSLGYTPCPICRP